MTDQRTMKVLREETVAPAGHFAAEIRKGQVLRIVDVEGQQVADLVTINAGAVTTIGEWAAWAFVSAPIPLPVPAAEWRLMRAGLPVAWAYPSAMPTATPSCRARK